MFNEQVESLLLIKRLYQILLIKYNFLTEGKRKRIYFSIFLRDWLIRFYYLRFTTLRFL